jgi:hypothetical protein
MSNHHRFFTSPVVVGEAVTGYSTGPGYRTAFSGVYEGVQVSEWDGEPVHFFRDGIIGDTAQGVFTFPVAQVVPAADRVARRAREIFAAWAKGDARDRRAMKGWRTMSVEQLHGVCDPNAAFDSAASDEGVDDSDWDAYLVVLNDAVAIYDAAVKV